MFLQVDINFFPHSFHKINFVFCFFSRKILENVEVLFRHRITNQCAFGEVRFNHKKAAIVVKTPPYHDPHVTIKLFPQY